MSFSSDTIDKGPLGMLDLMSADRPCNSGRLNANHWAIVLAGGRGERLRETITQWMGSYRPKQFCRFAGEHTMLENTWHRARQIVGAPHIVTVSVADQATYFDEIDSSKIPGTVLYQPDHNGTAAAIFLALTHILTLDPDASVIIMPSDHFIFPLSRFVTLAKQALDSASNDAQHLILLGAEARWPNPDFGWIESTGAGVWSGFGTEPAPALQNVSAFLEKPDNLQARRLFGDNALWSTMIVAVKARLLWQLAEARQPRFYLGFLYLYRLTCAVMQGQMPHQTVDKAMHNVFQYMPALDFSADMLQSAVRQCLVLPMTNIDWDDWGRPERILQCIERYGLDSSLVQRKRSIC